MKKVVKELSRYLLYLFKKKNYKVKVANDIASLYHIRNNHNLEYFFGYYDRSPEYKGKVLFHEMQSDEESVNIIVKDINANHESVIANTQAFNWQMGARAIWIDEDTISYNDFDGNKYVCKWYSLSQGRIVKLFNKALQDYKGGNYYLGVNYQRLRSYAKEYAYYCLPEMTETEYDNYKNDGIWKVDIETGENHLLLSIAEILKFEHIDRFDKGKHFLNHIMMSPNGSSFIFIHRYYVNGVRYDRLMFYDFKQLKVLMNERIQSHYCWLDDTNVFGYGEYEGKRSFNAINVKTGVVTKHEKLTAKHPRDGHPTVFGDWIGIDDYPNLSRMQPMIAYNYKTKEIKWLGEFYHDLKHKDYNRCDLHPRFSKDGSQIYLDTIYSGKRELVMLNVKL